MHWEARHTAYIKLREAGHSVAAAEREAGFAARVMAQRIYSDPEFAALDAAAAAHAIALAERTIVKTMLDNPKWAAWFLERKAKEEWGKPAPAPKQVVMADEWLECPTLPGAVDNAPGGAMMSAGGSDE